MFAQIQLNEAKFWFHSYYNYKIKLPLGTDIPDISGTDLIIDTFSWNMYLWFIPVNKDNLILYLYGNWNWDLNVFIFIK